MNFLAAALAALAVTATAPLAAQAPEPSAYQAGVAARQAGEPAEAKRLLQAWLADHPDDVDARLQLAYAELALGNRRAAREGFEAVLRRAPDYGDARQGLALALAREASPAGDSAGQLLLEGALSDLAGPVAGWSEVAADLNVPVGQRTTLGGRAAHYRRFGLDDVELAGRIGWRASDAVWLRVQAGFTPEADFRPEFAIGGGVDLRLTTGNATVLTLDTEYQRYPLQEVVSINPGLVQYLADGRAWITLRGIGTIADGGALQAGGLVRGDYAPADGWRVFAGVANGPDTDLGIVTRVTSLFGGVEVPLGNRFGITGSVAQDWREAGADRTEFRLGLKVRL